MSKIKILPEILSNKIAAGEVVERPASIVKELIENALDANSSRIMIEVKKGGRSLIRVSDNGAGMSSDDAILSLERYATSKIYTDEDLFAINTLGFRGEALPSIAAVSKFCLVTKDEISPSGTEIIVHGGTIKKVSEVGAPQGTMVTAEGLFFNMPARRKFLKTVTTEMGHLVDAITKIALGRPDVQLRLTHNEKLVKNWPATGDRVDRIIDVLGIDVKDDLCKMEFSADDLSITGWISSARNTRRTSRGIYLYVNGRVVRDRIIQHALFQGYSGRLVKGQFPLAVLFIHVPYDQVDVNVHPAKHEVRFAHQKKVHEAIRKAVAEALQHADQSGWNASKIRVNRPSVEPPGVFEPMADFEIFEKQKKDLPSREMGATASFPPTFPLKQDLSSARTTVQTPLWEKKRFGDLRVIGQFRDMYILCESGDGLILIDQHAAHERILFEQLKNRFQDAGKMSQKLLIPETIDLGYREAKILERLIPNLFDFGLEIAPFGGDTFVVKTVPLLLKNKEIKPLVIEMVEKTAQIGFSPGMEAVIDRCLELMACHGAVRANQKLSDKEIRELLDQLDTCDQPSNCPHGRPTWIRWSFKDLEKLFKRIV
ncbi:MAG: DNA mismatch repair endonuclease MutL [Deltaproteobacteria bacterium]|nr:DNA mismatch repair endonuclease MutL [Deltaproteobacteria bacterium]